MKKPGNLISFIRHQPRWRLGLVIVFAVAGAWWWLGRGTTSGAHVATFTARRGPLEITVLEGGSLQALESQEIKCEVRVGYQGTKILRIVDEGYLVTEEDVKTNKMLVELDSSEIEKQIVQQEIQYQSAAASLTDAQQGYEIQVNQNQSDVKGAEQKVRFARMDFDKFLGDSVTEDLVKVLGLDALIAEASTNNVIAGAASGRLEETVGKPSSLHAPAPNVSHPDGRVDMPVVSFAPVRSNSKGQSEIPQPAAVRPASAPESLPTFELPSTAAIDFGKYAHLDVLGDGEAKQKLRKMDDDLQVAQKELGQAKVKLDGTQRLFQKGFVTKNDLQQDEIAYDNSRLKVQTAETARDLYLKYDFPKSAEESLSKYLDAVRELDKTRRLAISKLAQAEARLNSSKGQYEVQLRQRTDLQEQREKCLILAKKSGLVIYGGGREDQFSYGGEERIREGATVRERQAIITIPDMSRMSVNVKIHESYIKKVKKGLKARITVDAFPDEVLTGEVTKVAVLPDSANRWMSPDLKVYLTTITIDGTYGWVKPGMSAKVEILVNKLDDVVYIPVQAVSPDGNKQICYVGGGFKPERREVQVGDLSDEFIEVKNGVKEGERVLLRLPDGVETNRGEKEKKPANGNEKTPATGKTEAAQVGVVK